jgi:hypothetical protein
MADLARIRFVTARIPELYGLTALPWCAYGAADLAWHFDRLSWLPRNAVLTPTAYAWGAALLALTGDVWIRRRYAALYGRVTFGRRRRRVAIALAVLLAYITLTGVSRRVHGTPDLGMLFLSACCWYVACRQRPCRAHYAILAGAAIAVSGLIWTDLPRPVLYAIYQFAFIGGLAIAGVGDHLLLARTAPPPPPRPPEEEVHDETALEETGVRRSISLGSVQRGLTCARPPTSSMRSIG